MCLTDAIPTKQAQADAFAERMLTMLNQASLALMTSIGHRTGLFDTIAGLPPATSAEIATAAGLDERYVREWLGAMVTGQILNYDPQQAKYHLPREHAAMLTRAAAPNNLASFTQFIPVLGSVEDQIVTCFRDGGGVPYSQYPRFHSVMAEESGQTVCAPLIDAILPLAPGVKQALTVGVDVLDVGCGSGRALNLMARTFPKSRFVGYDFSEEAIGTARAEAARLGLGNVRFEVQDVATMTEQGQYALITAFDAIHDQARPAEVLKRIHAALRPSGTFLMQDIAGSSNLHNNMDHPIAPLVYTISCMHCMTVSLAENGDGLGAMWGREKALEMLADAGFRNVEVKTLQHDFLNLYYVAPKA